MGLFDHIFKSKVDAARDWSNRGTSLLLKGNNDEALKCYDKATKINPDDSMIWSNRGALLNNMDLYEEALVSFDKAIKILPDFSYTWTNRGIALNGLRRYNDAILSFDEAINIDLNNSMAWTHRGIALGKIGRYSDALISYNKALEINPKNEVAQKNRERINGQAAMSEGKEYKHNDENTWIDKTDGQVFIELETAGCPGCPKPEHKWKKCNAKQGKNGPVQFFVCEKCDNHGILFSYRPENDEIQKFANNVYFPENHQ